MDDKDTRRIQQKKYEGKDFHGKLKESEPFAEVCRRQMRAMGFEVAEGSFDAYPLTDSRGRATRLTDVRAGVLGCTDGMYPELKDWGRTWKWQIQGIPRSYGDHLMNFLKSDWIYLFFIDNPGILFARWWNRMEAQDCGLNGGSGFMEVVRSFSPFIKVELVEEIWRRQVGDWADWDHKFWEELHGSAGKIFYPYGGRLDVLLTDRRKELEGAVKYGPRAGQPIVPCSFGKYKGEFQYLFKVGNCQNGTVVLQEALARMQLQAQADRAKVLALTGPPPI